MTPKINTDNDQVNDEEWTLIDWDGNSDLGYTCWRKVFGRGNVSVGVGEFDAIVYDYGPNSDNSLSSTRWRPNGKHITETEAMIHVDKNKGKWD